VAAGRPTGFQFLGRTDASGPGRRAIQHGRRGRGRRRPDLEGDPISGSHWRRGIFDNHVSAGVSYHQGFTNVLDEDKVATITGKNRSLSFQF
jgi:hypothetical protein